MTKGIKAQANNVFVWIIVLGLVAYVFNFGGFQNTVNNLFGPSSPPVKDTTGVVDSNTCPTDGTTTYTLNIQDELTSSATNVDSEYFIFNGNKLIKEGSTGSDGTVTVDVACGKDFKLLLVNTTTTNGHYPVMLDLKARIAEDTVNARVVRFGNAKIVGIENPDDPAKGSLFAAVGNEVQNFNLKFSSNKTEKGYYKPIILCEAATSNFTDITIGSFSDGSSVKEITSIPRRISTTAGKVHYGFEYPKMLTPKQGTVVATGSITTGSVTASNASAMTCTIVDQAAWKKSDYKVAETIEAGFPTGPENTETLVDVGGPDSSASNFTVETASAY